MNTFSCGMKTLEWKILIQEGKFTTCSFKLHLLDVHWLLVVETKLILSCFFLVGMYPLLKKKGSKYHNRH